MYANNDFSLEFFLWEMGFQEFLRGWVFSVPLLSILSVHEMGHYIAGRRHHLSVTLPYFIPAIPPLGTFGAFIKIKSIITDRRALVQVGAWGPVAGALTAVPFLVAGLCLSEMHPDVGPATGVNLGSSLILETLCYIRFGEFSFNSTIILHPTAMAAWFGLFITAMNLLPMGQLDGGHIIYALFGAKRAHVVSLVSFGALVPLGIFLWTGWFLFGILVFFLGLRHPPPLYPDIPLDSKSLFLGWAAIILFVLTFIPMPVDFVD